MLNLFLKAKSTVKLLLGGACLQSVETEASHCEVPTDEPCPRRSCRENLVPGPAKYPKLWPFGLGALLVPELLLRCTFTARTMVF